MPGIDSQGEHKEFSTLIRIGIAFFDALLLAVAFFFAFRLRFEVWDWEAARPYAWLFYVSTPAILFFLYQNRVFTGYRYRTLGFILVRTVLAFAQAGILCSALLYLAGAEYFSRLLFGYYFVLGLCFVLGEKIFVKCAYDYLLKKGIGNINILLLGWGAKADHIAGALAGHPQWGLSLVERIDPRNSGFGKIQRTIIEKVVDEVYICMPRDDAYHRILDELITALESYGVAIKLVLNFDDRLDIFAQQPCRVVSYEGLLLAPHNLSPDQLVAKRMLDIAGALVGIVLLAVVFPIVGFAIKLDSRGPVFYRQWRVGKNGRRFRVYKFRSMYEDAEKRKQDIKDKNIHEGPLFKVEDDPRITRVGRFLRRTNIDEVPQFINVLKGEMSLVGTRPPTEEEVCEYNDCHYRRISIKPGITGLWQISGRNKIRDFDEVVSLDVQYIKNWSVWMDIRILLRTLFVWVTGKGRGM